MLESPSEEVGDIIDRISNLPGEILHHIFSFLNAVDLVRTRGLSRKWGYLWTTTPYLDFNVHDFDSMRSDKRYDDALCDAFKDFVNWVLLCQGSSGLIRFSVNCNSVFSRTTLLGWINAAVGRNVQEINLSVRPSNEFELPYCLVTSECLRVLKLGLFLHPLKLPNYVGFIGLKSLVLEELQLFDDDLVRNFFSSCPSLEELRLVRCVLEDGKVLDVSSKTLKHLTVDHVYVLPTNVDYYVPGFYECKLKISCPNLVSFKYNNTVAQDYIVDDVIAPDDIFIAFVEEYEQVPVPVKEVGRLICKILKGFSCTRSMELCLFTLSHLNYVLDELRCFPSPFHRLRSLKLWTVVERRYMQTLILLLKHAPNLEVLTITFDEEFGCLDDLEWQDEHLICLESHLKLVELIDFKAGDETELLCFLLRCGHVLEKIIVVFAWEDEETNDVIEMIPGLPKASPYVAVSFFGP